MIKYASDEHKNTYEIGLEAVNQNGLAFEYLSDDLKKNDKIQTNAIEDSKLNDKDKEKITQMFL